MTVFVNAIMYYKVKNAKNNNKIKIMYYKVKNAIHAVANVDDYGGSARLLAATTLRKKVFTNSILKKSEGVTE